jgi:putative ATPase
MSLFADQERENLHRARPLASRMRPATLDEFVGQEHFLGKGKLLRRLIQADQLTAVLFYGPPGTGKTTLAHLLARETACRFCQLNAVTSGIKDLRAAIEAARDQLAAGGERTLLFIDEIHRFNKAQQDALLPDVEEGTVVLVGATTANPFFAVNRALVSRSRVFEFQPLSPQDVRQLIQRALADPDRGLGKYAVQIDEEALQWLAEVCDGDARRALGALETAVLSTDERPVRLDRKLAEESVQRKIVDYDRQGDAHYDITSALIKSLRGSDPDAALYWLARMIEGGEDLLFICRRLVILASEDIGNADPQALPLAIATLQACQFVGLPECQLSLAQCVTYLACAPKSNAATTAIAEALADVRQNRIVPVPYHLRDAHYQGAPQLGHGTGYQYSHDHPDGVAAQSYLGVDRTYYHPTDRGAEAAIAERLAQLRAILKRAE